MKLARPPKGEIALGVSSKTSLASPKSEVISVRVVLCRVGPGCLSINPYAHNPSRKATFFSKSEFGFNSPRPCVFALNSFGKIFRHRHGLAHGHGLVDGLLKFAFGRRVVHPAAASLNVSLAVLDERGADGDAGVQIAVERKIADAARIRPARGLFQF